MLHGLLKPSNYVFISNAGTSQALSHTRYTVNTSYFYKPHSLGQNMSDTNYHDLGKSQSRGELEKGRGLAEEYVCMSAILSKIRQDCCDFVRHLPATTGKVHHHSTDFKTVLCLKQITAYCCMLH